MDEDEQEAYATLPRHRLSTASKIFFGIGGLMLVVACLLVASVLSGRLFARGIVVSSAAATETALAALRPAVNTPIPILPTAASSGAIYPTAAADPPTRVTQSQPTTSNSQPTAIVARPTSPAQQAGGGVLAAEIGASVYQPNDTFRLVVQAASSVTSIMVRWYGPDGSELYKVRKEYSLSQAYNADFILKNAGAWPAGSYRADIYTNDSPLPATSLSFSVAP